MAKKNWYLLFPLMFLFFLSDAFILNLFLGEVPPVFLLIGLLHFGFLLLSIHPLGAFFLRIIYDCRKVRTQKDKEYLLPIFEEVKHEIALSDRVLHKVSLDKKIKVQLYIINDMSVNAFSIGMDTIALTRGAIKVLTINELKGVMAHEFGHIVNGDTIFPIVLYVGSVWCLPFLLLFRFIKNYFQLDKYKKDRPRSFFNTVVNFGIGAVTIFFQIILSFISCFSEYEADKYACYLGYQEYLIQALYTLREIRIAEKTSILDRLTGSHPDIDKRIENLEYY